ncbi:MAG: TetR/AcrR family transcriptional regulator [Solirubrobacterales bacterium]
MDEATRARMSTDERREQLLGTGVELLGQRGHDEVSIEEIAEAAGVSKGLLYHYFPTKKDFILAALERGQRDLSERLRPDPELDPPTQLDTSLDAFLDYVEEHATAYTAIFRRGGGGDPEIGAALDAARGEQIEAMLVALAGWRESPASTERTAALEAAVQGWTFFVEGAVLRQLEHGGLERPQLRALVRSALVGSVLAAGEAAAIAPVPTRA